MAPSLIICSYPLADNFNRCRLTPISGLIRVDCPKSLTSRRSTKIGCPTLGASLFLRLGWEGAEPNRTHEIAASENCIYRRIPMPKRIAFCFDGTWQTPLNGTNVYRLYKALTVSSDQVTYYDDGVGADATGLNRVLQGAFGEGLLPKLQEGYPRLAHDSEE